MKEVKILKQEYNGRLDKNGQSMYQVMIEGDVEFFLERGEIENPNGTDGFITGTNGKTYEMIIKDKVVTKVIEEPRFI